MKRESGKSENAGHKWITLKIHFPEMYSLINSYNLLAKVPHDFECVNQPRKHFSWALEAWIAPLVVYCAHLDVCGRLKPIKIQSPLYICVLWPFLLRFLVTSIWRTVQNYCINLFFYQRQPLLKLANSRWEHFTSTYAQCIAHYMFLWLNIPNYYPFVGSLWTEMVWKCKKQQKIVEIDHECAVAMHIYTHGRQHAQKRACLVNEMQTKLQQMFIIIPSLHMQTYTRIDSFFSNFVSFRLLFRSVCWCLHLGWFDDRMQSHLCT